jgi:hypothetical protein
MWIRHLGISLEEIDSEELLNSRALGVHNVDCIDNIISRYPEIFEEIVGCIPGVKVSLCLCIKAKQIFHKE